MKKELLVLICLYSTTCASQLTIDECLRQARSNSKRLEMVRFDLDIAKANQNEALSLLLPQIRAEGRYELKNIERDYSVFTDFGSAFSSKTVGVTANVLLFDFFSSWNLYRAGRFNTEAAQKNLDKSLVLLDEEVKSGYFRLLEAEKAILVVEESIRSLERQMQTAQDYFTQGMVSKTDLLSVEVLLAEKKKARLRAQNEKMEAQMTLNRMIGQDLFTPLSLEDVTIQDYGSYSIEYLQELALSNRSDRKALQAQIAALEARYQSCRAMHAPKFFLFGGYTFLQDAPVNGPRQNESNKNWVSGGVGVQFPLFEGGKTSAAAQKALAMLNQAKAQLEELDTQVMMEVDKSYLLWQEQLANISIEETAIHLAEENLRSMSDRYSQGLVSINDLLKANEQIAQSKMGQNRAIYHYHTAYAHLTTVVGGKL
jgi:outer membrane protein